MKAFLTSIRCILLAVFILGIGNSIMAQSGTSVQINDGAVVNFNAGTYTGTVTSATSSLSSTAVLNTNGVVTLSGDYSNYYGSIIPASGGSLSLNSSSFASKLSIGNSAYSGTTTVTVDKSDGVTISQIGMDKYGILDVIKNLTVSSEDISLVSSTGTNAPYIKFNIAATTPKITISGSGKTIVTDGPSGSIDITKNTVFNMASAPTSTLGVNNFTVATFLDTDPLSTGLSPSLINNTDNMWVNPSISYDSHNMIFHVSFAPTFDVNSAATTYVGNLTNLLSSQTPGQLQKLLKNHTLTSGYTLTDNLILNLQSYNLIGGQTLTIAAGKLLGIKGSGTFTNNVGFGNSTAEVMLIGAMTNNQVPNFSSSSSSGSLRLGDGTTTSSLTIDSTVDAKFGGKVSQIKVNSNSVLTVTP